MAHIITWRTSSHTEKQDCVEVARLGGNIGVRDSKFPRQRDSGLHEASVW